MKKPYHYCALIKDIELRFIDGTFTTPESGLTPNTIDELRIKVAKDCHTYPYNINFLSFTKLGR